MMHTVCILLSTYNGEKYLHEQIDSLLQQEGVELMILARDDGSTDGTVEILKEYASQYDNFNYYVGNNLKPAQSFFDLIKNAPKCEYYAFSDQDDVWDTDKIICAINYLELEDKTKPNMYYSNLRIVDSDLVYYRLSHSEPCIQKNKYSALTEDIATGCTIVFNDVAEELVRQNTPKYCSMHDTWLYLVCKFLGNTVYDFSAHISYRQHENNVVGTYLDKKTKKIYIARIKRLFNRKLQPRYNNACNFYNSFGNYLNEKDSDKILKLVNYKSSLKNRLSLLFDRDIVASSLSREIRYLALVVLGIV